MLTYDSSITRTYNAFHKHVLTSDKKCVPGITLYPFSNFDTNHKCLSGLNCYKHSLNPKPNIHKFVMRMAKP